MAIKIPRKSGEPRHGVVDIRAPDGSVIRTVQFYTDENPFEGGGKITDDEKDICDGIVSYMAEKFGKYVEATKKIEIKKQR